MCPASRPSRSSRRAPRSVLGRGGPGPVRADGGRGRRCDRLSGGRDPRCLRRPPLGPKSPSRGSTISPPRSRASTATTATCFRRSSFRSRRSARAACGSRRSKATSPASGSRARSSDRERISTPTPTCIGLGAVARRGPRALSVAHQRAGGSHRAGDPLACGRARRFGPDGRSRASVVRVARSASPTAAASRSGRGASMRRRTSIRSLAPLTARACA